MFCFLLLSLMSGCVELGSVYLGIKYCDSIPLMILLPLSYQIGNLMMEYVPKNCRTVTGIGITAVALSPLNLTSWNYPTLLVQIMMSSFCIQVARDLNKKKCPTWLKRTFRIGGFAIAPSMLIANGQIILILCLIASVVVISAYRASSSETIQKAKFPHKLSFVMILHQMHYFVYTYIMPIYIYQLSGSFFTSATAFAITWIVYLLPQSVFEKMGFKMYKTCFYLCHAFLALCLLAMSWAVEANHIRIVLLSWLLTGLGGGSVFCIRHLSPKCKNMSMDFSENLGHVLGPMVAIIICFLFPGKEMLFLPFVAFIFVVAALVISIVNQMKE